MANKVFNFGKIPQYDQNLRKITYKDISMDSSFNPKRRTYDITSALDVESVKISMRNLFTFIPGERILDPEYGNSILQYLYNGINDYTKEQITAEIQQMISKYEPRATVDSIQDISSVSDHENNTIQLKLVWHVVGLDDVKYDLMVGI